MVDTVHQFCKNIHLLCKLRVLPKVILIMILQNKGNSPFFGIRKARFYAFCSVVDAFFNGEFRSTLPRKNPAIRSSKLVGHPYPIFLLFNFLFSKFAIRMGKVGG